MIGWCAVVVPAHRCTRVRTVGRAGASNECSPTAGETYATVCSGLKHRWNRLRGLVTRALLRRWGGGVVRRARAHKTGRGIGGEKIIYRAVATACVNNAFYKKTAIKSERFSTNARDGKNGRNNLSRRVTTFYELSASRVIPRHNARNVR